MFICNLFVEFVCSASTLQSFKMIVCLGSPFDDADELTFLPSHVTSFAYMVDPLVTGGHGK